MRLVNIFLSLLLLEPMLQPFLQVPVLAQSKVTGDTYGPGLGLDGTRKMKEIKLTDDAGSAPRKFDGLHIKDVFPIVTFNYTPPNPVALQGMRIDTLTDRAKQILGYNQFVVYQGSDFANAATMYSNLKAENRPNLVTADAITHCYFSQINLITVKVIEGYLFERLEAFLSALIQAQIKDYRQTEFAEVKDDIQRNLAYAIVALRLLKPDVKLPDLGGATDLALAEGKLIEQGKVARSVIFNRLEDYGFYVPIGFYARTERAARFYKAQVFLSRMRFQFADLTDNSETGGGNAFRRAILLYRAIELGRVKSANGESVPLLKLWQEIFDVANVLCQNQSTLGQTVYPSDMKNMFQRQSLDIGDVLKALGQPLSRARMLLAVKKQRPQGLNSTSIFQVNRLKLEEENATSMRLLPQIIPTELDWLKQLTNNFKEESSDNPFNPLSLFILYAWGSGQASNLLAADAEGLEQRLASEMRLVDQVPALVSVMGTRKVDPSPTAEVNLVDRRWALITEYFRPYRKNVQPAFNSEAWANQRLCSASAAYLDSYLAVRKAKGEAAKNVSESPKPNNRPSNFHYLEPCPEMYRKMAGFLQYTESELTRHSAFPDDERGLFNDFSRLLGRLAQISDRELSNEPLPVVDFNLLANIDKVLEPIDSDWAGSMHLSGAKQGANLVLSDPSEVFFVMNTTKGAYLTRGAIYSYFELQGNALKNEHISRKKAFGFLRPPSWVSRYAFARETPESPDKAKAPGQTPVQNRGAIKQ